MERLYVIHYQEKGNIGSPHASLTDLMVAMMMYLVLKNHN